MSFLGSRALADEGLKLLSWVGLFVFAVAGVACVGVLWPHRDWVFSFSAGEIIDGYVESDPPESLSDLYRDLALFAEEEFDKNERKIAILFVLIRFAGAFLVTDIIIWLLVLRG